MLPEVARRVLEPLAAGGRRLLQLQHVDLPGLLVGGERGLDTVPSPLHHRRRQRDGVLHRQLGPRAHREVGRVGGVAEQRHVAVVPARAAHGGEAAPDGAVRHQLVPLQELAEQRLAEGDRVGLARPLEARRAPHLLAALHDPRRHALVERVGVDLEEPVLGLGEEEGEGVERTRGAQPAEAAGPLLDGGLERRGELAPRQAVDAIGRDDEVVIARELAERRGLVLEAQLHAERAAALVEDGEQCAPRERGEAVAARHRAGAAVVGLDRLPAAEARRDRGEALRVGVAEGAEGLVGEDDAEAVGVVGAVALHHGDAGARHRPPQQQREVEPARPAAQHRHAHGQRRQISRKRAASAGPRPSSSCLK